MALALLGTLGLSFWDQVLRLKTSEPAKRGLMVASRSHPAYAVSRLDMDEKSEVYEII